MRAVQEMIRIVHPVQHDSASREGLGQGSGRFLIFVWAYEQRGTGRRKFDTVLADDENAQDVLVPWVMTAQHTPNTGQEQVHQRCTWISIHADYHLFREGELQHLVAWAVRDLQERDPPASHTNISVPQIASGWDKGNWWGVWRVEQA